MPGTNICRYIETCSDFNAPAIEIRNPVGHFVNIPAHDARPVADLLHDLSDAIETEGIPVTRRRIQRKPPPKDQPITVLGQEAGRAAIYVGTYHVGDVRDDQLDALANAIVKYQTRKQS